ncbi:MAG TPA: MoxR family ATPase [Acidimicrobiales bacterium]|nr:MoxR family ATPase [Acidimicrobiales bacterium]
MRLTDRGLLEALRPMVVGRRRELEGVVAALAAGRHVLLEGPPGTGKSTLLRAVAHAAGVGFEFVEGNAELTPARLVGHHDPSRVMAEGYSEAIFVDGPLALAMRSGSLLYVEEINRVPEETLNLLITVMSEGELHVPRLGRLAAADGFRLVAAMNPFDAVGTARISSAIYDRTCRVLMGYQSATEEATIVARSVGEATDVPRPWIDRVVEVVRLTRSHPDVRVGASVRGAVDLVLVAATLGRLRGVPPTDGNTGLDAALAALSGRIRLLEGSNRSAEDVVTELWEKVFGAADPSPDDGEGDAPEDGGGKGSGPPV